ncbi:MAG: hypothetical protein LQ351_007601 [Letrouitia transgressa]|nr:MAG: hypothetical protein LQ351_007601 [Letrouitia transgressa]
MPDINDQSITKTSENLGTKESLVLALDKLLQTYLSKLDQYQSLQQALQKELSSVWQYHGLCMYSTESTKSHSSSISGAPPEINSQCITNTVDEREHTVSQPYAPGDVDSPDSPKYEKLKSPSIEGEPKRFQDPLRWFGILVPPALRQSQGTFKSIVTLIIPALVNSKNDLTQLEIDIRRTRKKIKKAT